MELFDKLMKEAKYWIRFELGLDELKGKDYFNEIHHRVSSIFHSLFYEKDTILLIATVNQHIDYRGYDLPGIHRFMKNTKLAKRLIVETVPYEHDEEDTERKTTRYSVRVEKGDLRLGYLFRAIANKDFGMKPTINGNIYLLNLTRKTLLHMYDDRGCDVYSSEKETLLPIYHKFRKWILDYNRIQIDHIFQQGLYGYYETSKELENRLKTNNQKVKETKINLFLANTCEITHQLEIPKEAAEECVNEMRQTGFTIEVDQDDFGNIVFKAIKTEALALIDYQSELISLYAKKYKGKYNGWSAKRVF
ncbi:DUF3885 domain-containing protein [Neobacillus sp. YIM B06451]|uniref:DUF3885 domain-containing protein n=1 Tax=Neobacillus sp. YIM B06451 TaxID=3070994 RepID=UPI00292EF202|nr:DUF3885 domain-containing protein [Neobacillus sp. YIM B06451]